MSTTDRTAGQSPSRAVFGLTVSSDIDLPELSELLVDPSEADVNIVQRPVSQPEPTPAYGLSKLSEDEYLLRYEAAMVRIAGGTTIEVDPDPSTPGEILRHVVLGPAMHFLLHQRGLLVLHASTVEVDGRAVAFLGESGRGKTTAAAACLLAGHNVVSDDAAAVSFDNGLPFVRRGYPAIKLDDAFVDRFDPPVEDPVKPYEKRSHHFHELRHDPPADQIPFDRSYLLVDGDRAAIEPVAPAEQVAAVAMFTYASELLSDPVEASENFDRCSRLVEQVSIKRLVRPRRFDALPKMVDLIEADG